MPLNITSRARLRVILIVVVTIAGLAVFFEARTRWSGNEPPAASRHTNKRAISEALTKSPTPFSDLASPSPTTTPQTQASLPVSTNQADETLAGSFVGSLKLTIPVAGVRPDQLLDTFTAARSEGRSHDAIDILAPAGTPVLAASDGEIIKLFQSDRGGTTIYQLSTNPKVMLYYAHLQRYAEGLTAGKFVKQGEVIAYVGDTGNAGAGNFHLHFSISIVADPKRYWEGTYINPYPSLHK
ncbi:MAG: M23 family metallopeptidase [Acidobacteriota bacterium]